MTFLSTVSVSLPLWAVWTAVGLIVAVAAGTAYLALCRLKGDGKGETAAPESRTPEQL